MSGWSEVRRTTTRPATDASRMASVAAAAVLLVSCTTEPITDRTTLQLMPESTIRQVGTQAFQQVLSEAELSDDPRWNQRLDRVGRRLATVVDEQLRENGEDPPDWEFRLFEDSRANAFALPGGRVAFFTGILPICEDENGVAVVMAHEIAHVYADHANSRVSRSVIQRYGLAVVEQALLGEGSAEVRQLTMAALGSGSQLGSLAYGRGDESQADELGMIFMARAGYDP